MKNKNTTEPDNCKVICSSITKGGSTKTQTTLELAAFLAQRGKKVIIFDVDPQHNATMVLLRGREPDGRCLSEILFSNEGVRQDDIMTCDWGNGCKVDFLCGDLNCARIEARMPANGIPTEYILIDLIQPLRKHYDFILLDTPPAAEVLSMSSLLAADGIIIPALTDAFSYEGVDNTIKLVNFIQNNPRMNPHLSIIGIMAGRVQKTKIHNEYVNKYRTNFGNIFIEPVIPNCTRVERAIDSNMPVILYDPTCAAANSYIAAFSSLKLY